MTTDPLEEPGPLGPAEEMVLDWALNTGGDTLLHDLTTTLDLAAGLADAQLPARHSVLTDHIEGLLDLDAGLTAVLAAAAAHRAAGAFAEPVELGVDRDLTAPGSVVAGHRYTFLSLARLATVIDQTDPGVRRLRLRGHPLIVRVTNVVVLVLHLDLALNRAYVLDRARTFAGALRAEGLGVEALSRAFGLARALDRALDHAHDLARALDPDLARALARARDLVRAPVPGRGLLPARTDDLGLSPTRPIAHVRDRAETLVRALVGSCDFGHHLDDDLDRDFDVTRDQSPAPLARALEADVAAFHRLRDDFTHADLRRVDLSGMDLEGVRWSRLGTHWPPEWFAEIDKASVDVEDEPGIRVVRGGRLPHPVLVPA